MKTQHNREICHLGIDVSKAKLDAILLNGRRLHKVFSNDADGFNLLREWLKKNGVCELHACMEATGKYWKALGAFLNKAGYKVSVENPYRIKSFARSQLRRTKTDKADADVIADYCRAMNPKPYKFRSAHVNELQEMSRRLEELKSTLVQETNRLYTAESGRVRKSISQMILTIKKEIKSLENLIDKHFEKHADLREQKALLESIPGVGRVLSLIFVSEGGDVEDYKSARECAAGAGLTPEHRESGSSVHGRASISKKGNARLRRALYLPAVVAVRKNPVIKEFYERLLARGKAKKVAVVAAMRKLLHIMYGVLKNKKAFDPNFLACQAGISR